MTRLKNSLYLLVLLALVLPAVQKVLKIVSDRPLDGYFEPSVRPAFSLATFKTGEYQALLRAHMERTIGFRTDFVRVFNQIDYSFFNIAHAAKVVVGTHGMLQADSHIEAYTGKDFAGKIYIDDKVSRLGYLRDLFARKGVKLLVVFAPGKGYYYPNTIPARFLKHRKPVTNLEYYTQRLSGAGIDFIDFNAWMVGKRDTANANYYPVTGIHWSCYGAYLCLDSLTRYIEKSLGRPVPHLVTDLLIRSPWPFKEDADLERVLNIYTRVPGPEMTYPVFHYCYTGTQPKPKVLFVSDSFYWYWQYNGMIKNLFDREDLWYYDKEVYPAQLTHPTNTTQINLDSAICRQDVVILMQTNGGYGNIGYDFVDRVYEHYYPLETPVKKYEALIRSNASWLERLQARAQQNNLPLDGVIRAEALYMYNDKLRRISKYVSP